MSVDTIKLVQGQKGMELPFSEGNWVLLREEGYSPVQSLVASAGACGAYVYQSVLEKSRVPFTFDRVEMTYERDETLQTEPVKRIEMTFFVKISEEKQGLAERSLKLVGKYCPVIQSLNPNIEVIEKVEFI